MTNNSALLFMSKFICIFLAILRSSNSSPFGPPYPITAAFFQDRFSKTEWNKTLTDFKEIGGDTVLLRAPAIKLTTEDELEQDPDFQVPHFDCYRTTSVARTRMARLPRSFRTRWKKSHSCRFGII